MLKTYRYFLYISLLILGFSFHVQSKPNSIDWSDSSQDEYVNNLVECKTKLDKLNWSYNIWPKENKKPKPAFEEIVDRKQIRNTVLKDLKMQALLQQEFHFEITPAMIQHDMNRMAKNTKDANRLKQMFAALDNNPRSIAECISRPYLVQTKLANQFNFSNVVHADVKATAEFELEQYLSTNKTNNLIADVYTVSYQLKNDTQDLVKDFNEKLVIELDEKEFQQKLLQLDKNKLQEKENAFVYSEIIQQKADYLDVQVLHWKKKSLSQWVSEQSDSKFKKSIGDSHYLLPEISESNKSINETGLDDVWETRYYAPAGRSGHTAIWTGTEMIIWGGIQDDLEFNPEELNSGSKYDPASDSWTPINIINTPDARYNHTAVWTGTEMIVWGGRDGDSLNSGGRYNPNTDTWTSTDLITAPVERYKHTAVWTGTEMIIWGGYNSYSNSSLNTGSRYNPEMNSWTATSIDNVPDARANHIAVWTGIEMIVWGGNLGTGSGGKYNPANNTWADTNIVNTPPDNGRNTGVWTGIEMIICADTGNLFSCSRYNPQSDTWISVNSVNAPSSRYWNTAVWTGSEMIIWGGHNGSTFLNNGSKYNPSTDLWSALTTDNAPIGRYLQTAIWTGADMIVWGGQNGHYSGFINSGGRYNPNSDQWLATSIGDSPVARRAHVSAWTGSTMLIWGGHDDERYLNDGGKYYPVTDTWVSTETTSAPVARRDPTAIWTGSEMIVWGGYNGLLLKSGGRYNPNSDSWTQTTINNAPLERLGNSAVWTGSDMIIWGGYVGTGDVVTNTGGVYNPDSNSWGVIETSSAPESRVIHSAVWTEHGMIIWGGYDATYNRFNNGSLYNPIFNSWRPINSTDAPNPRAAHTGIWTGTEMIIWGGEGNGARNDGGIYQPNTDTWFAINLNNAPENRYNHTAVWTGTEMIIWGGYNSHSNSFLKTGSKYNPVLNQWTSTNNINSPEERHRHTAIWTGTEMIIWGGDTGNGGYLNSMGIYHVSDLIFKNSFE